MTAIFILRFALASSLYPELEKAITEILSAAHDQTREFRQRLRKLIENATLGNFTDDDVREVIELAMIDEEIED
jgi:hypothetical protein